MKYTKIGENKIKAKFNLLDTKSVTEDKNKYLFEIGKTIGFRKDKNLEKFVGLRDGYSKQLEFSLISIIIDGNEKVVGSKFGNVKLIDDVVLQDIDGFEIYNRIDSNNYRNLVKIKQKCNTIEIIYKIDLTGLKILNKSYNSSIGLNYLENEYNQFIVSDNGNDNKIFIIDKPFAFDENNNTLDIVNHELYLNDGILYYKKIVNEFNYYINNIFNLPIYIDANIQFGNSFYYTITKTIDSVYLTTDNLFTPNWNDFLNNYNYGYFIKSMNDTNIFTTDQIETDSNVAKNVKLSRNIFNFDLSILEKKYGTINITEAYFNFYTGIFDFSNFPFVLQKLNYDGSTPDFSNWTSYKNDIYTINNTNNHILSTSSKINIPHDDLILGNNNFMLRSRFDYEERIPNENELYNYIFQSDVIKESTLEVIFDVNIYQKRTLTFDIEDNNSLAVLESKSDSYLNLFSSSSTGTLKNVHSSSIASYENSFGYKIDTNYHYLYRTYFSFDTSIINSYKNVVIRDIRLKFTTYENKGDVVSLYSKSTDGVFLITDNNKAEIWDTLKYDDLLNTEHLISTDYTYINNFTINYIGNETVIRINKNNINENGFSNFCLIDYNTDYLHNSTYKKLTGIDFSTVKLEVDFEPYLISGVETKKIIKGSTFELNASMNTNNADFKIIWFSDYILSNILGIGSSLSQIDSNIYSSGDKIYAAIYKVENINNNQIITRMSINTLEVTLDVYENKYDVLYINKKGVYDVGSDDSDLKDIHTVNLDNIYFKYENGVSGICYSYARDLSNIYENNPNVSDGTDIGSYNMYNEFDIIDEFYSNVKDVDVAVRFESIDLNKSYKELDGIILHEGSRVLLYSGSPNENDGIYTLNHNLKLIKTTETENNTSRFRYKANVKFGTYLDYEFHTFYYENDSDIYDDSNQNFNFQIFDSSLYGDTIIDMGTYYDKIFDPTV